MRKSEFLDILEPLEPKLFGFAFRMLRQEDEVKDAMQELMLRMWKKRKQLNKNDNISAYCFKALNNICIDTLRHNGRFVQENSHEDFEAALSSPRKRGLNEPVSQDHTELISQIQSAVTKLPTKQRTIIELHDFQEFSHKEIAEMLDMEINAVRTNLSRARAAIKAQFRKEEIYV
jgi:RNA polymerase sigma factor (sigma-70 family)